MFLSSGRVGGRLDSVELKTENGTDRWDVGGQWICRQVTQTECYITYSFMSISSDFQKLHEMPLFDCFTKHSGFNPKF